MGQPMGLALGDGVYGVADRDRGAIIILRNGPRARERAMKLLPKVPDRTARFSRWTFGTLLALPEKPKRKPRKPKAEA